MVLKNPYSVGGFLGAALFENFIKVKKNAKKKLVELGVQQLLSKQLLYDNYG